MHTVGDSELRLPVRMLPLLGVAVACFLLTLGLRLGLRPGTRSVATRRNPMDPVQISFWDAHTFDWLILIGLAVFVISLAVTSGIMVALLVAMPVDHLVEEPRSRRIGPAWKRWLRKIGKNLLGVVLVIAGIVLSLPGVPGQGLLTILAGLLLLDFPGKHRLVQRLFRRPRVMRAVNRIRARFRREPLLPPDADDAQGPGDAPGRAIDDVVTGPENSLANVSK